MDYYFVMDGKQSGPFSLEQLTAHPIPASVAIWREGLSDWLPPAEIPEIAAKLRTMPPPIPLHRPSEPPPIPTATEMTTAQPAIAALTPRRWPELRLIAARQRELLIGLAIALFVYVLVFPGVLIAAEELGKANRADRDALIILANLVRIALGSLMGIAQLILAIRLAKALKHNQAWLWGVGSCICFVGLFALFVLNQQATAVLQQAGIKVGFLGTKLPVRPTA